MLRQGVMQSATSGPKSAAKLAKSIFKDTESALYRFPENGLFFPPPSK